MPHNYLPTTAPGAEPVKQLLIRLCEQMLITGCWMQLVSAACRTHGSCKTKSIQISTFWYISSNEINSLQSKLSTIPLNDVKQHCSYQNCYKAKPWIVKCSESVTRQAPPPQKLKIKPWGMMLKDCLLFSSYRGIFHLIWFPLRLSPIYAVFHSCHLSFRLSSMVASFCW